MDEELSCDAWWWWLPCTLAVEEGDSAAVQSDEHEERRLMAVLGRWLHVSRPSCERVLSRG